MTHEEAVRRWNLSKESKRACGEELLAMLKVEYRKLTGKEPTVCEVW